VIMGLHHNQDIRWMGGVRKYMPITWITSLLGSLALIGTPLFSGFYSKDSIIEAVAESHLPGAGFAHFAVLAGVFVTAFYSFRMYFLVFHGPERYHLNPDAHHHDGHHAHGASASPHESPWVVTLPLILLAIPSVVIGFFTIDPLLFGGFFADAISVNGDKHHAMHELAQAFHGPLAMASHALGTAPFWLAVAGTWSKRGGLQRFKKCCNPCTPCWTTSITWMRSTNRCWHVARVGSERAFGAGVIKL